MPANSGGSCLDIRPRIYCYKVAEFTQRPHVQSVKQRSYKVAISRFQHTRGAQDRSFALPISGKIEPSPRFQNSQRSWSVLRESQERKHLSRLNDFIRKILSLAKHNIFLTKRIVLSFRRSIHNFLLRTMRFGLHEHRQVLL